MRSLDEMSAHEAAWEASVRDLGGSIYSSYFLTKAWFEVFGRAAEPRIIAVEEKGEIVGLAPLCTYRYNVKGVNLKVLSLAGDLRDRLRLSTNSILCAPDRPDVLDRILKEIKALDWSILWTINMERTPQIEEYVQRVRSTWRPVEREGQSLVTLNLPSEGNIADLFEKSARKSFDKRARGLEREGHRAQLRKLGAEDIDHAVDVYAQQHIERWASKGGSYFRDPDNVRFLKLSYQAAWERGMGFAYELLIDGRVAAQNFGFVDGELAYSDRLGMSNEFMKYSPGWMIKNLDLTDLRDHGVKRCQIGTGSEQYKFEMGGEAVPLTGIGAIRGAVALLSRLPWFSVAKLTRSSTEGPAKMDN